MNIYRPILIRTSTNHFGCHGLVRLFPHLLYAKSVPLVSFQSPAVQLAKNQMADTPALYLVRGVFVAVAIAQRPGSSTRLHTADLAAQVLPFA